MKKVLIVVGTRPNFIKVTQFKRVAKDFPNLEVKIVHTGQHFDDKMADVFFKQFGLHPDFFLNIPVGTPNSQMANIMLGLEKLIREEFRPELIIVPGDVNSTLAAALTANKLGIKLAHLESGLRSNDRSMPEEINRILTDEISDYYFITEESGIKHLKEEDKKGEVHFVGNTMIDTLVAFEDKIGESDVKFELGINEDPYILLTVHRPANVDHQEGLIKLIDLLKKYSSNYKLVFPVHPRTVKNLEKYGLLDALNDIGNVIQTGPLGYFEFQRLIRDCAFVLTDSGGIQEETTFRQKPCITLRPNTERPSTIDVGTNTLTDFDLAKIDELVQQIENGTYKNGTIPDLWDGMATFRIVEILNKIEC